LRLDVLFTLFSGCLPLRRGKWQMPSGHQEQQGLHDGIHVT